MVDARSCLQSGLILRLLQSQLVYRSNNTYRHGREEPVLWSNNPGLDEVRETCNCFVPLVCRDESSREDSNPNHEENRVA